MALAITWLWLRLCVHFPWAGLDLRLTWACAGLALALVWPGLAQALALLWVGLACAWPLAFAYFGHQAGRRVGSRGGGVMGWTGTGCDRMGLLLGSGWPWLSLDLWLT